MLFKLLFHPGKVFNDLSIEDRHAIDAVPRYLVCVLLLPPLFSLLGASQFGWRLGGSEPVFLDTTGLVVFGFFYFSILAIGFFGTVYISRWMATTYGAKISQPLHFSLFTVVCAPLVAASAAHLYPDVFFNVLILIPALIWSITLMYRGLPIVLGISSERGMLMASALVGWLLVAAVSLLGICVGLWINGAAYVLGV